MIVVDASALLAFLFREKGHATVAEHLDAGLLSTVNLAEVLGRFARDGMDVVGTLTRLEKGPLEIVPFERADARIVAEIVPATRSQGLSLGDRACLALARRRSAPALTADRGWATLDVGVEIRLVR